MELFLDTAEVDEVKEIASWGILDGVTTNPSLIKKSGRDFKKVIKEIAEICDGPISAEVTSMHSEGMIEEGLALKLDPKFIGPYLYRAKSFIEINDKEAACKDWNKSFQLGYKEVKESINSYCK